MNASFGNNTSTHLNVALQTRRAPNRWSVSCRASAFEIHSGRLSLFPLFANKQQIVVRCRNQQKSAKSNSTSSQETDLYSRDPTRPSPRAPPPDLPATWAHPVHTMPIV